MENYDYLKDPNLTEWCSRHYHLKGQKEGWLNHWKRGFAIFAMVPFSLCPCLSLASRLRGLNCLIAELFSNHLLVRHFPVQTCAAELKRQGMVSVYAPENVGVLTDTDLFVAHPFPPIHWWQKASPTSFTTQLRGSGGYMKENVIPQLLILTGWAGKIVKDLRAQGYWASIGCDKINKDCRRHNGVIGLAVVRQGWNPTVHPPGHVYYIMQRTHTHKSCNSTILIIGECFIFKIRAKKAKRKYRLSS